MALMFCCCLDMAKTSSPDWVFQPLSCSPATTSSDPSGLNVAALAPCAWSANCLIGVNVEALTNRIPPETSTIAATSC